MVPPPKTSTEISVRGRIRCVRQAQPLEHDLKSLLWFHELITHQTTVGLQGGRSVLHGSFDEIRCSGRPVKREGSKVVSGVRECVAGPSNACDG